LSRGGAGTPSLLSFAISDFRNEINESSLALTITGEESWKHEREREAERSSREGSGLVYASPQTDYIAVADQLASHKTTQVDPLRATDEGAIAKRYSYQGYKSYVFL
jgi:hypothetical protein